MATTLATQPGAACTARGGWCGRGATCAGSGSGPRATLDTPFSWLPSLLPSFLPCHRDGRAACRRAPSRTNLHSLPTTPTSRGRVCRFEALWAGSSHTAMAPRRTKAAAVAARGPSSHSHEHLRASLASSLFTRTTTTGGRSSCSSRRSLQRWNRGRLGRR